MTQIQQQLHKNTRRSSPVGVSVQNTTLAQQFTKEVTRSKRNFHIINYGFGENNNNKKKIQVLSHSRQLRVSKLHVYSFSYKKKQSYSFVNVECYRPHLFLYV